MEGRLYYLQCYRVVYRLEILVELEMSTRFKQGIRIFKTNPHSFSTCLLTDQVQPSSTNRFLKKIPEALSVANNFGGQKTGITDIYFQTNITGNGSHGPQSGPGPTIKFIMSRYKGL